VIRGIKGGNLSINTGSVSVESGAKWTISDPGITQDLMIGLAVPSIPGVTGQTGPAIMTIQSGGSGSNARDAAIGLNAGADGSLIITGNGSAWTTGGAVVVGLLGTGGLDVANGGSLTSGADSNGVSGYIGQFAGSKGLATIEGENTNWEANGDVQVGVAGVGTLEIRDRAQVQANNMSVGTLAGGDGTLSMTGGCAYREFRPYQSAYLWHVNRRSRRCTFLVGQHISV
jgi:T5SS/PEP-CTERM-associated repeat protein